MDEKQLREFYNSINKHLNFLDDLSLNANGDATVKAITDTINKYSNSTFIKKVVGVIDNISHGEYEFCKKLFEVCCCLIKYRMDPAGHEIIFTPQLLIQVKQGDCKKFTTFICCVLKCKGIKSASKVVNYDADYGWQHIYAIAFYPNEKGYLTLDPVNHKRWNTEVAYRVGRINFYDGLYSKLLMAKLSIMGNVPDIKFLGISDASDSILGDLDEISGIRRGHHITKHHLHAMENAYINGIYDVEGISGEDIDGVGKRHKKTKEQKAANKARRKAKRKKIFKGVKKVGLAPVRVAFLTLIRVGELLAKSPLHFNLAKKLAELWLKDGGKSITDLWEKFGGKRESLKKQIIKASKVQIQGIAGTNEYYIEGIGNIGSAAALAASLTAAAPILVAVISLLHKHNVLKKEHAAEAENVVQNIEDANTDSNGNLTQAVTNVVKNQASKLIDDAVQADDGGNKSAQRVIVNTPTNNDAETTDHATVNLTSARPDSGGGDDEGSASRGRSAAPAEQKAEGAETPAGETHAGFNLMNASSWINGSLTVPIMGQAMENENIIFVAGLVSGFLFVGGVILIVKSFLK
jgi:hypothetical protein